MGMHKVTVFLIPLDDDQGYMVSAPLFPSCTTHGRTVAEAMENFRATLRMALADGGEDEIQALKLSHAPHAVVAEVEIEAPKPAPAKASKPRARTAGGV